MPTGGVRARSTNFKQLRQASRFWRSAGDGRACQPGRGSGDLCFNYLFHLDVFDFDPPPFSLIGAHQ